HRPHGWMIRAGDIDHLDGEAVHAPPADRGRLLGGATVGLRELGVPALREVGYGSFPRGVLDQEQLAVLLLSPRARDAELRRPYRRGRLHPLPPPRDRESEPRHLDATVVRRERAGRQGDDEDDGGSHPPLLRPRTLAGSTGWRASRHSEQTEVPFADALRTASGWD